MKIANDDKLDRAVHVQMNLALTREEISQHLRIIVKLLSRNRDRYLKTVQSLSDHKFDSYRFVKSEKNCLSINPDNRLDSTVSQKSSKLQETFVKSSYNKHLAERNEHLRHSDSKSARTDIRD